MLHGRRCAGEVVSIVDLATGRDDADRPGSGTRHHARRCSGRSRRRSSTNTSPTKAGPEPNVLPSVPAMAGGGLRPFAISADAINEAWLSPDGSKLVYVTWGSGEGQQGRIHTVDLDTGTETALMFEGSAGTNELEPQFSPDGSRLVVTRYDDDGGRVTVVPAGCPRIRGPDGSDLSQPGRRRPLVAGRDPAPGRLPHRRSGLAIPGRWDARAQARGPLLGLVASPGSAWRPDRIDRRSGLSGFGRRRHRRLDLDLCG